jgi:hypothetical protein
MLKSFFGKSKTTKVVKTKSGSSTYSKIKSNGKTKWLKTGGTGRFGKKGKSK